MNITLTYSGNSKLFTILSEPQGFGRFDEVGFWPPEQQHLPDGSIRENYSGARRVITVRFGVVSSKTDRAWFLLFVMSNAMQLTYNGESVNVVLDNWREFGCERLFDFSMTRSFTIRFLEKTVLASAPGSWNS